MLNFGISIEVSVCLFNFLVFVFFNSELIYKCFHSGWKLIFISYFLESFRLLNLNPLRANKVYFELFILVNSLCQIALHLLIKALWRVQWFLPILKLVYGLIPLRYHLSIDSDLLIHLAACLGAATNRLTSLRLLLHDLDHVYDFLFESGVCFS